MDLPSADMGWPLGRGRICPDVGLPWPLYGCAVPRPGRIWPDMDVPWPDMGAPRPDMVGYGCAESGYGFAEAGYGRMWVCRGRIWGFPFRTLAGAVNKTNRNSSVQNTLIQYRERTIKYTPSGIHAPRHAVQRIYARVHEHRVAPRAALRRITPGVGG